MKKILLLSLTLMLTFCGVLYAAGMNGQYKSKDIVKVTYEGRVVKPPSVPGYLDNGSTMIPLGMLRSMGFTVEWNQATLTANVTTKQPDPEKTPLTLDQVKGLSNAVAIVYALDDNGNRWRQGSGFIINSRGLLITAYHVAEEEGKLRALEVEVNGKTYKVPAGVCVFADQQKDIFGVYLQDTESLPYLKVSEEFPKFGEDGFTISNPKGVRNVITDGYFTAAYQEGDKTFISGKFGTDGGSSGGPLLNQYGEAVGVIFGGGAEGSGITITRGMQDIVKAYQDSINK